MTRKQRRFTLIGLAGIVLAVAAGLVLYALSDRIVFFNSPSDVLAAAPGTRIRLGGLVANNSLVKGADGSVRFVVTDGKSFGPGRLSRHPARPLPRRAGGRRGGCGGGRQVARRRHRACQA